MKKIVSFGILWCLAISTFAQQKTTIRGKFLNCTDRVLELVPSTGSFKDSVLVNPDGTFSYTTTAIKEPFRANLTNRKQIQIQLFLAPSYDLQINADVKDNQTIKSSLSYVGLGGKTNTYWNEVAMGAKSDTVKWVLKSEDIYINYLKTNDRLTGIIAKVFTSDNQEPYAAYFKNSLLLDKKFGHMLTIYNSYAYQHKYSWDQIQKMILKLGYTPLSEAFKDEKNLASSTFSYLLTEYPFYCDLYKAFPADSAIKAKGNYSLYLAAKFYTGKVYDYYAAQKIESDLRFIHKLDGFTSLQPYIQKIGNPTVKAAVRRIESQRMQAAIALQAGSPSPLFNLADTSGKFYQLDAMKGKVVYIDLWASWCGPCKEETPHLKKVYDVFKNNNKIQIISIASFDAKNRARRYDIIKKDGMNWLQLEDTNDSFAKSYHASSIPRFIIIDKLGKIVDSDAVRPSDTEKLMTILNREISK